MTSSTRRTVTVAVAVIVALAVVLIAASMSGGHPSTTAAGNGSAGPHAAGVPGGTAAGSTAPVVGPITGLERRQAGDPLAQGNVNAPVVMVAFSDFQCPFCGRFARQTEPSLVKTYVQTGILRIEWRDFPYLGPDSTTAAYAGRAAAAQGKFWQFHDAVYATQFEPNSGALASGNLDKIAVNLGLDMTKFHADMASPAVQQAVAADFALGQRIGITGTPTFIINGTPIVGAQPLAVFSQAIDAAAGRPAP